MAAYRGIIEEDLQFPLAQLVVGTLIESHLFLDYVLAKIRIVKLSIKCNYSLQDCRPIARYGCQLENLSLVEIKKLEPVHLI